MLMIDMFFICLLASLQITCIHILFFDGMIFSKFRLWYCDVIEKTCALLQLNDGLIALDHEKPFLYAGTKKNVLMVAIASWIICRLFSFLKNPLFDCLVCMTSVWGTVIYLLEFQHMIGFMAFIFTVGGINTLIYGIVGNANIFNGEKFVNSNEKP